MPEILLRRAPDLWSPAKSYRPDKKFRTMAAHFTAWASKRFQVETSLRSNDLRTNLTRADLADAIYPHLKLPRRDCADIVDQVLGEIVETLAAGEEVKLSGFGTFQIRAKAERMGRNPKSGAPAAITPRRVVVFRASRVMKAHLSRVAKTGAAPDAG